MQFYNIKNTNETVSFRRAVLKGVASGQGLFFPAVIPKLPEDFYSRIDDMALPEMASEVLHYYTQEDFTKDQLDDICTAAFNFSVPLVKVEDSVYTLELFHGPSLAFKDVGARFLAEVLKKVALEEENKITVLVATSGDTGSAVAKSFYNVEGVEVVLLYPSGKVSALQEKTLTTMGGNISALEVDGAFDDCQRLVKFAFADDDLNKQLRLTSANSINIGRFLPQVVYYFWAWKQLPKEERDGVIFSVPSGNYGNLSAGILAHKMGLPVNKFIASSNINKVFPDYLETGTYEPRKAIQTISNAMDVGDPSNFVRITEMFHHKHASVIQTISHHVADDEQTKQAIKQLYTEKGYLLDPHGAIGYLGCKHHLNTGETGIFLETAHPGKFKESVEGSIGEDIELSDYLKELGEKEKQSVKIKASYKNLKDWLLKDK